MNILPLVLVTLLFSSLSASAEVQVPVLDTTPESIERILLRSAEQLGLAIRLYHPGEKLSKASKAKALAAIRTEKSSEEREAIRKRDHLRQIQKLTQERMAQTHDVAKYNFWDGELKKMEPNLTEAEAAVQAYQDARKVELRSLRFAYLVSRNAKAIALELIKKTACYTSSDHVDGSRYVDVELSPLQEYHSKRHGRCSYYLEVTPTFEYQGVIYDTRTGRALQNARARP